MAVLEHRVITGILREQDLTAAISTGLVANEFKDVEARQIYQHIYRWWHNNATSKTVPTVSAIRRKWPSFEPTDWDPDEDGELKSLVYELKMRSYESDILGLANYFSDLAQEDPGGCIGPLKKRLDDLAYRMDGGTCFNMQGIIDHTREHYEAAQSGKIYGIPWPWEPLTEDTLGKLPEKFIVFYGRMKSMKTWLILASAVVDFMTYNKRVMIWSREMDERELGLRIASIICGVDYQLLKKGKLPPKLRQKVFDTLSEMQERRNASASDVDMNDPAEVADLILLAGHGAPKTMDELRGAVHTYQPEILYADSFYHLRSERAANSQRWQQVAAVAEDLKTLSQDFEIPVVGTTQANRSGEKIQGENLTEVADADNIAREADLVIRVIKRRGKPLHEKEYEGKEAQADIKADKEYGGRKSKMRRRRSRPRRRRADKPNANPTPRTGAEIALILGGNRDGVLEAFTIHAIPGYNFKVIDACFSSDEVRKWVNDDDKKMAAESKGQKAKKFSPKTFKSTAEKTAEQNRKRQEYRN